MEGNRVTKIANLVKFDAKQIKDRLNKRSKTFSPEVIAENKAIILSLAANAPEGKKEKQEAVTVVEEIYDDMTNYIEDLKEKIEQYGDLLDTKLDFYKGRIDLGLSSIADLQFCKDYYDAEFFKSVPLSDRGKVDLAKYLRDAFHKILPISSHPVLNLIIDKGLDYLEDYSEVTYLPSYID